MALCGFTANSPHCRYEFLRVPYGQSHRTLYTLFRDLDVLVDIHGEVEWNTPMVSAAGRQGALGYQLLQLLSSRIVVSSFRALSAECTTIFMTCRLAPMSTRMSH